MIFHHIPLTWLVSQFTPVTRDLHFLMSSRSLNGKVILTASLVANLFLAVYVVTQTHHEPALASHASVPDTSDVATRTDLKNFAKQMMGYLEARPGARDAGGEVKCPKCPTCQVCPESSAAVSTASAGTGAAVDPNNIIAALPHYRIHKPTLDQLKAELPAKCHSVLSAQAMTWDCFNSQWCQDWFLYSNYFRWKGTKGFYVDIGANSPRAYSNTWFFDFCLGWEGICVEPGGGNAAALRKQRSCQVYHGCIYSRNAMLKLGAENFASGVVGFISDEEGKTNCTTFSELLRDYNAPKHIDFVTLDVEGAELHALVGWPNETEHTIDILMMENNRELMEQHVKRAPLYIRGYSLVTHLQGDDVYVRNKPELMREKLLLPRATQSWEAVQMRGIIKDNAAVEALMQFTPNEMHAWKSARKKIHDYGWPTGELDPV